MKKILVVLVFLLLNAHGIVEDRSISLQDAINLALSTNPQIRISILDVEISKNDIKTASKLQNPSIGTFHNIGSTATGNPQQIGVDYTIELLKRGKRKKQAQSKVLSNIDNHKYQEQMLILEVKKAYINLLLKKTNLRIVQEQKELSKELLNTINSEVDKGIIPKTEAIQAKIDYNRNLMYARIAKSEVIYAQNAFNTILNSSDINYDTKEDFLTDNYQKLLTINPKQELSFEKIKNYTLSNRYDLKALKQEVETSKLNLETTKSSLIPDIELQGGYGYLTKGISDTNTYTQGAYAGVNITNIPLFYNYKPEINNAKYEIEKAQLRYKDLEIDIIRNITDAYEKYTIAKNNLNFYNEELLPNSKELLETSKKSLDRKEIDLTSFLVSKKLYLELILGYNETLGEYYTSYAELLGTMCAWDLEVENI